MLNLMGRDMVDNKELEALIENRDLLLSNRKNLLESHPDCSEQIARFEFK